ncbi:PAS domain-containing sensor histidine kinase [Bradyrhizobium sp. 180]|uniref:sensor histidine kinase n=1 Tax=unclassified Bradyrhizobium TaxID=2631580 RepID=UPI001FF83725|nr:MULTISPECIES: PAS domain-containing sensor histidine kinase [unclassified Bradyrhizobium]MCK1424768.1 PAS domain-containing sensor histidine kinase [Bradyrhizobium sp. CW12]MCK1491255.1 PAS domain-containing sensor histidine kinase [Bradyrhizobium sp. 180]MCK1530086.1 PAS domain-containing sensor histidine kinase [Bradyrhizobium sp. 182]MCK1593961.1 PAS domain-containing sensor histidine kinase [Bradyrhizobium sp. 164]MCK1649637.1 PAS domain-containing sensor histidine kinase [Bradyrhizobiu
MTSADTSAASFDTAPAEEPKRWSLRRWLAPFAVALALLSALLTFLVLTGLTKIEPTPEVVRSFYLINAATILLLVGIIVRELWQLILARRRGRAAARLHVQIVSLFSIVAVLPAVLVAVVANVTIERGLDRLFSGPTKEVIQNSLTIARAYMQDHAQLIRGDILGMANDIAHARPLYDQDRRSFREMLTASAGSRNLPGAMIIDKNTNILESADTGMRLAYSPPAPDFLSNVNESEPEIAVLPDASFVAAVIRLRAFSDTFLYVARPLDPNVVNQLKQTEVSVAEYAQIESRRLGIQVAFALMFAVIALTILMASVLIGLNFANSLVSPIRRLMNAAHTVSTGDLHVQVPVHQSEGDLAQLGETFNKMTQELRSQRDELVNASDLIDSRRRFIEAVLSSASAGIIGVDTSGSVGILNRSAEKLIGHSEAETLGHPLSDVLPELDEMMKTAREGTQRLVQGQITITRDGTERNLSVRVSAEKTSQPRDSYIITLDDITELVSAQRTSAWGDVARRIAHEIKNPLTPIQLSAERIRRKFGKTITEDKDKQVFDQCTDTIVRQVDDIRRMVDEFSRFARMPKPVMEGEDVADTVRQAVFLMKVAHPEIDIEAEFKEDPLRAQFDRRLISQAVTNIVKNATEAIEQVPPEELGKENGKGRIDVVVSREGEDVLIDVIDNGIGLPKVARSRLLEPYVTTRAKGTGLGLAIVGRVLEDHGGRIELKDASDFREGQRGAWMRLRFAISGQPAKSETAEPAAAAKEATKSDNKQAVTESIKDPETKEPAAGTKKPTEKTNDSTKIEASTGS